MYKLLLVNHTQFQYIELCRSNFSQERVLFMFPSNWEYTDETEIMTEFIFREKLKNRKNYQLVDMFDCDDLPSSLENSDYDDENEHKKSVYTHVSTQPIIESQLDEKEEPDVIASEKKKKRKKKNKSLLNRL